jgi:hypothetical protein
LNDCRSHLLPLFLEWSRTSPRSEWPARLQCGSTQLSVRKVQGQHRHITTRRASYQILRFLAITELGTRHPINHVAFWLPVLPYISVLFPSPIFFLGAFAKLRRATLSLVMSVCLSVRMEQLGSDWMDFHAVWYLRVFSKNCIENYILREFKLD